MGCPVANNRAPTGMLQPDIQVRIPTGMPGWDSNRDALRARRNSFFLSSLRSVRNNIFFFPLFLTFEVIFNCFGQFSFKKRDLGSLLAGFGHMGKPN